MTDLSSPVLYWASHCTDAERRSLFFSFLQLLLLWKPRSGVLVAVQDTQWPTAAEAILQWMCSL